MEKTPNMTTIEERRRTDILATTFVKTLAIILSNRLCSPTLLSDSSLLEVLSY